MLGVRQLLPAILVILLETTSSFHLEKNLRSPSVEIIMQLPSEFRDVDAFRSFLGIRPERRRRDTASRLKRDTEAQEGDNGAVGAAILQQQGEPQSASLTAADISKSRQESDQLDVASSRMQREAMPPPATVVDSPLMHVEPAAYRNAEFPGFHDAILALAQQGPSIHTEPDPDDPRRRRNTSDDGHESSKRSFGDDDTATRSPSWKQNKMNQQPPQFVTGGREGRQKYDQLQHRSGENARESHSMKDGKSISTNEIPRVGDLYFSPSNSATSRAYTTRASDVSAPVSAYDTIDFTRRGQARNADARGRLTQDSYVRSYDRYNGYYPLGAEIATRGVEYYHRSTDPGTGRIIYYASLPEPDPYRSTRTFAYDPYARSLPAYPGFPTYTSYQNIPYNPYQTGYQPYSPYAAPIQDYSKNTRYQPLRSAYDDPRNKTYVIYDVDDKRSFNNAPISPYENRYAPPLPYPSFAAPVNYNGFQPYPTYTPSYTNTFNPYGNRRYPEQRSLVTRQVDLPISTKTTLKPVTN